MSSVGMQSFTPQSKMAFGLKQNNRRAPRNLTSAHQTPTIYGREALSSSPTSAFNNERLSLQTPTHIPQKLPVHTSGKRDDWRTVSSNGYMPL